MIRQYYPWLCVQSVFDIDFEKLYAAGFRGLIFDIDNTLVPHGAPADQRAIELFEKLRAMKMDYCLISNNQLPRVKPFADSVQAKFVENAHKPAKTNYLKAMQMMKIYHFRGGLWNR